MIPFEQLRNQYSTGIQEVTRRVVISVLAELETKPDIKINHARIEELDRLKTWPAIATDTMSVGYGLGTVLSYKGVAINMSLYAFAGTINLHFPAIIRKKVYTWNSSVGGRREWSGRLYDDPATTKVTCSKDTDELYKELGLGYKRYEAKQKKIAKENVAAATSLDAQLKEKQDNGYAIRIV